MIKLFILLLAIQNTSFAKWKVIPFEKSKWTHLHYKDIKKNEVQFLNKSLIIKVNHSSSPIVYKFKEEMNISSVKISSTIKGKINYSNQDIGIDSNDDFPLRIGLITKGKNSLNFFQKAIAPKWLIELNKLAKEYEGFGKVHTLVFYQKHAPKYTVRNHPLSDYFYEVIAGKFKDHELNIQYDLKKPFKIIGLWISSDGDDTSSKYLLEIKSLQIK